MTIFEIQKGDLPEEQFLARLEKLGPHDLKGHKGLLAWAKKQRLAPQRKQIERLLPEVVILHRIHSHPKQWCRPAKHPVFFGQLPFHSIHYPIAQDGNAHPQYYEQ